MASLVAHQLKGPVAATSTILETLLGEFAGPLSAKQRDMLQRALSQCKDSLLTAHRLLAISKSAQEPGAFVGRTELVSIVRRVAAGYTGRAADQHLTLTVKIDAEPAWAVAHEAATAEVVEALLSNAFKYTPDNGKIEVLVLYDESLDVFQIRVSDSGVGVPEHARELIFQPFYRTPSARDSARPGTGLGLAFVKAVVESVGGTVSVAPSHLGGAALVVEFKAAGEATPVASDGKPPLKVVIIGGVAAGPKAAAKINRLDPDADVTIVEKGQLLSYAGCGLPYYVAGIVKSQSELMSSPVGIVRDIVFFQQTLNLHIMNQTEALGIDREHKQVQVRSLVDGRRTTLDYDKLVVATGSTPIIPDVEGVRLGRIFTLHGVSDAEGIKAALERGKARDVVIMGGGLIGLEVTEALVMRGCRVTIVEKLDQILRRADREIALLIEKHLESHGVRVLTGTEVKRFIGDRRGTVAAVETSAGTFPANLCIIAVGNLPTVDLAAQAGLELGETGAIKTNSRMQTNDEDIYAAGDCVECVNLITGQPCWVPLGSNANRQGRVAAVNICGGDEHFAPIAGTTACRIFGCVIALTGLTEQRALQAGFDTVSVLVPGPDREHFVPGAGLLLLKIVVDRKTRRLLGAQATGAGGDKRIDVAAVAIAAGMTVDQVANLDLGYAPPFGQVIDNLVMAANVARNKLDGYLDSIGPLELKRMIDKGEDFVVLDVRTPTEYDHRRIAETVFIPLASLRSRYRELDQNRPIVAICNFSLRAYEAAIILRKHGFRNVKVLEGGLEMWPY
ncbi:MAG TPA: FAD-dependent oxidoreductase [Candidatus Krumholzibacteria bacterium]|nr:FAD-dependent oxidoreductase [Candidatus Krumholzibacteria bacterium]HPD70262.1 FAD-dependent oxidoreductase [Candidatus Krumholzibacteria bacterium]HRY40038.1 FAD-dependent oxidoreductase [Candidatus Krumholzibacteria bacterium]